MATSESNGSSESKEPKESKDSKDSKESKSGKKKFNPKRYWIMLTMLAFFLLIAVIWILYYVIYGRFHEYTDDAYVNGNVVQLVPRVSGTVIAINTDDTRYVEQGQLLVQLDKSDNEIAFQHAKAALALTVRQVHQYYKNAETAQATLLAKHADLIRAQLDLKRRVGLVDERAISREDMQHIKTAAILAQADYNTALFNLSSTTALVANTHLYTHPIVEQAKANLKTAYLNLKRTKVVAPVTGFVAKRNVQVGQQVNPSTPMLAIVPLHEIWVDANYKETQLGHLRIGQPVDLAVDAYDDIKYHGKVVGLSAGTGAAFSILPPQNATGNWIKIVQRLPVRIGLDPNEIKKYPLHIGLSVRVTTNTHNRKGQRVATMVKAGTVYGTDVYNNELQEVERLINSILTANSANLSFSSATKSKRSA